MKQHPNDRVNHVAALLAEHGRGFHLGPEYAEKHRTPNVLHVFDLRSPANVPITKLHITARKTELACPNLHGTKVIIPHLLVDQDTTAAELGAWCRWAAHLTPGPTDPRGRLLHQGLLPDVIPTPPEGTVVDGVRVWALERHGDRLAVYVEPAFGAKWPKAPKGEQGRWPVAAPVEGDPEALPKHVKPVAVLEPRGSDGRWTVGRYGAVRWAKEQPTWGDTSRIPDAPTLCPEPGAWAPLCPVMVSALGTAVSPPDHAGDVKAKQSKPGVITICGPDWSTDVGGVGTCEDTGLPLGRYSAAILATVIRAVKATEIGPGAPGQVAVRGPKGTAWLVARTK